MDKILTKIKKDLKSYKDYWNLSKEDKLTLERETFNLIKSGKINEIGKIGLGERIKILKEKNKKKSGLVDKPLGAGGKAK